MAQTVAAGQADCGLMAVTGGSDGSVQLWRVHDDGMVPAGDPRPGHAGPVQAAVVGQLNGHLVAGHRRARWDGTAVASRRPGASAGR